MTNPEPVVVPGPEVPEVEQGRRCGSIADVIRCELRYGHEGEHYSVSYGCLWRIGDDATPGSEVPEVEQEPVQDWFFSFGQGQQAMVRMHVNGFFVRINGTFDTARAQMVERFGDRWSWQYSSLTDMQAERFGMREIALEDIVAVASAEEQSGGAAEEQDQHGMPRTLEMLLDDLINEAGSDGDLGVDEPSEDTEALRREILRRWPLLPEEPSGGAAALRADVVTSVLEEVEALRRDIDAFSLTCSQYGRSQYITAVEEEGRLASKVHAAGQSITARLDRIEAAVREGEQR